MWVCTRKTEKDYIQHGGDHQQHRYVSRTGGPGNYKYVYPGDKTGGGDFNLPVKKVTGGSLKLPKVTPKQSLSTGDPVKDVANLTGMKEEAVKELQNIAQTKGYDSKEYQDESLGLAEGDPDYQAKITKIFKDADAKKASKKSVAQLYKRK